MNIIASTIQLNCSRTGISTVTATCAKIFELIGLWKQVKERKITQILLFYFKKLKLMKTKPKLNRIT